MHPMKSPQIRDLSKVYSSRSSDNPGIGYPSCSRDLCRLPPRRNYNDANNYYGFLGLPPSAPVAEIKTRIREYYRRYHTDGTEPDEELFDRTKMISETLLDPRRKVKYDDTPDDEVFLDKEWIDKLKSDVEFMRRMQERGFTHPSQVFQSEEEEAKSDPTSELFEGTGLPHYMGYDYFSLEGDDESFQSDLLSSAEWYHCLLQVAPIFSYKNPIKVLLHNGDPGYIEGANIMMIPRSWPPNTATAFSLFAILRGSNSS
jgi:hypothetical protein